jgi:hypothetical protein
MRGFRSYIGHSNILLQKQIKTLSILAAVIAAVGFVFKIVEVLSPMVG